MNLLTNYDYSINISMTQIQPVTKTKYVTQEVYCRLHGQRVHYQVSGAHNAPPLVLVHGLGGYNNWWERNIPAYIAHFRVYALDLPGFGQSQPYFSGFDISKGAKFLEAWLDFVGLDKIYLIGHSLGGQICTRFAAQHPHRIEKLILVAPSGVQLSVGEYWRGIKGMPKVKVPLSQTWGVVSGTLRSDAFTVLRSLTAIFGDQKLLADFAQIQSPTLLVCGASDNIVPPLVAPQILKHLKGVQAAFELIEHGTHDVMRDQPEAFNSVTLRFLREEC